MAVVDGFFARFECRGQDAHSLLVVPRQSLDDLLQDQIRFGESGLLRLRGNAEECDQYKARCKTHFDDPWYRQCGAIARGSGCRSRPNLSSRGARAGAATLRSPTAKVHNDQMFDWNDLRYFLAVARHHSTIAAG